MKKSNITFSRGPVHNLLKHLDDEEISFLQQDKRGIPDKKCNNKLKSCKYAVSTEDGDVRCGGPDHIFKLPFKILGLDEFLEDSEDSKDFSEPGGPMDAQ